MKRTEMTELTTLCMVYRGDKLLLQNRVKKDWKGYTFPGGHVEKGESFVLSVIREIKEETGLTIKNPHLCGIKQFPADGGRYIVFLFKTDEFEGCLSDSEEGKMVWVNREQLNSLPLVEDFHELLRVMDSDELTEFQYIVCDGQWDIRLF